MLDQHYPFTLPPLPCTYNALEPYIDTETMRIHHDIMFKKYVDNLNMIILFIRIGVCIIFLLIVPILRI